MLEIWQRLHKFTKGCHFLIINAHTELIIVTRTHNGKIAIGHASDRSRSWHIVDDGQFSKSLTFSKRLILNQKVDLTILFIRLQICLLLLRHTHMPLRVKSEGRISLPIALNDLWIYTALLLYSRMLFHQNILYIWPACRLTFQWVLLLFSLLFCKSFLNTVWKLLHEWFFRLFELRNDQFHSISLSFRFVISFSFLF